MCIAWLRSWLLLLICFFPVHFQIATLHAAASSLISCWWHFVCLRPGCCFLVVDDTYLQIQGQWSFKHVGFFLEVFPYGMWNEKRWPMTFLFTLTTFKTRSQYNGFLEISSGSSQLVRCRSLLTTIFLHEGCLGGWKRFWNLLLTLMGWVDRCFFLFFVAINLMKLPKIII